MVYYIHYGTMQHITTVRYGTTRFKSYTLNPTYQFDVNVDVSDEQHVVVDDDANDLVVGGDDRHR